MTVEAPGILSAAFRIAAGGDAPTMTTKLTRNPTSVKYAAKIVALYAVGLLPGVHELEN